MSLYKKLVGMFTSLVLIIFLYINFFVLNRFERSMIEKVPETSVRTIYAVVESYAKKVENKEMTEEIAKKEVVNIIKNSLIDKDTYFWIHDINNKMIIHPIKTELNNKDVTNVKDPKGNSIFVEMNNIVNVKGEGVHNYYWPKPGEKDGKEKTSFVKLYKPWGWVVGTGMYVDDVRASMSTFFNQIKIVLLVLFVITLVVIHFIVKNIIKNINTTVEALSATVHELQNSSQKMSLVSRSLASSVDSQVSSITQSVTAMDEIAAMIKQNEFSANQATKLSEQTKNSAESGKNTVDKMMHEMKEISVSYDEIHHNIIENGKEIQNINQVIKQIANKTQVINDIVFQTKLLSFNAAVEAARAGESGKGFAVVAEEVGNLANMSGQAASEINRMLEDSQIKVKTIAEESTKKISTIVEHGRSKVNNGNIVAEDCLKVLDQILGCVKESDGAINQISVAIREQSLGVEEVNKALKNLNDDATNSVKMSGSTKDASENLRNNSHQLRVAIQEMRKVLGSKKNYDEAPLE